MDFYIQTINSDTAPYKSTVKGIMLFILGHDKFRNDLFVHNANQLS